LGRDVSSGAASGRPAPTGPDARLPRLRTVDTIQGLESVGDDVSTYLRLLRRFLAAHRSDADRLAEDLRRKEAGRARDRAHALKGVAGALGANDVAAAAAKLDDELRGRATETGSAANDAELNGLLDDLDRALRQLAAEVHPLADETASRSGDVPSSAGAGMPEAPSARDAADRLMRLLADDDFEAVEEVERHRERLAALVGEGVADAVADAAARLDLPAALARLRDGLRGVERSDGDGGGEAASGTRRG
jgi:two-component system sensor histidine kinase/response regulator